MKDAGFRVTKKLETENDVIPIEFGLVTYAAFYTDNPEKVADALLRDPTANLAVYPAGDSVIVKNLAGAAAIKKSGDRYSYNSDKGDPLEMAPIIAKLKAAGNVDDNGFIDDRALFAATVDHKYPDPLSRIWLGFRGLVEKPADLIITLKDGYFHGSNFFHAAVGVPASTHGSLNRINSVTFAMTMLGDLPAAMRLEDILPALNELK